MNLRSACLLLTIAWLFWPTCFAETVDLRGADQAAIRSRGNELSIVVPAAADELWIPRVYAAIRTSAWKTDDSAATVTVNPEPDYWIVRWDQRPADAREIVLTFDTEASFADPAKPSQQLGDGRVNLHAYEATTTGQKLRYEPQPHKNTVGYWVNADDQASWSMRIDRPGSFNVGVLHGCGAGQGGSVAVMDVFKGDHSVAELEWEIVETGHFQNFVWGTVGSLSIAEPGVYTVRVKPQKIAKAALMDIRQIQLVRLP